MEVHPMVMFALVIAAVFALTYVVVASVSGQQRGPGAPDPKSKRKP